MLDWLLVGGGVHGAHLALVLRRAGVRAERLRVLDPHGAPLARWDAHTRNTGMDFLRSSIVHHLDPDPYSLQRFAASDAGQALARFARPYTRPALDLFQAHTAEVLRESGVPALYERGTATGLGRTARGWRVETDRGALEARRVALALGPPPPHWPTWARDLGERGASVAHLFEPGFCREAVPSSGRTLVVGGGISAAQLALALARRAGGAVTLVMRHAPRVHDLDADPGWMGPKKLAAFHAEACLATRRSAVAGARYRGSWPPGVHADVQRAVQRGHLALVRDGVTGASWDGARVQLDLSGEVSALHADRVVLATGFEGERPGGAWLARTAEAEGLPLAPCGWPRLTPGLCWQPGLFASGGLAELEVGPVARNIVGARLAALRIAAHA